MITPLNQRPRSGPYAGLNARFAKRFLARAFAEADLPFAESDALEIVLSATGLTREGLMLSGTEFLSPDIFDTIQNHMARRLAGEPVDHILGWREFYGRRFHISADVLSPRADSEALIRVALSAAKNVTAPCVLDLGTGSGALLLTMLCEIPDASGIATDLSSAALEVARNNAQALDVMCRTAFHAGSWWDALPPNRTFDLILSNPPYITDTAMAGLEREVLDYDPNLALRGGADGLDAYRVIISGADTYLRAEGWIGVEIGFDQAESVTALMAAAGLTDITVSRDLGGHDRVVSARKPT